MFRFVFNQNITSRNDSKLLMWHKVLLGLSLGFYLPMFLASPAKAQMDQGTITGVVEDTSGAVVPQAQVRLKSIDTGLVFQMKTDANGVYTFPPVKIGNYDVSASAPGFQTTI